MYGGLFCVYVQVTALRSYDTMIATARRQEEGSLIYIIDRADLYLRVRDGVRQVMVLLSTFQCSALNLIKINFKTSLHYYNVSLVYNI